MNITLIGVFLEGLLSFLSPCVLPLVPLYMSYLVGQDKTVEENGNVKYKTSKVFITTLFFIFGICFTLTLLAVSANILSTFLKEYSQVVSIVCGVILIIFGLHECGLISINILNSDSRFKVNLQLDKMNFIKAFLLGFVFSFGWSPCIGPMLANALMLTATESLGYFYIIAYGLGLVIPFLVCGLATSTILNFINQKKDILKWVLKVAGIIMILFGIYLIYSGLNSIVNKNTYEENTIEYVINYDFIDQNNSKISLADYKGKYIILNFTTTWCTYCKQEIPEYLAYSQSQDDVVCLYVMSKSTSNVDDDSLLEFIKDNIELPVIIDNDNILFSFFGISGYPMKYVIDPDGKPLGYVSGALTIDSFKTMMESARNNSN